MKKYKKNTFTRLVICFCLSEWGNGGNFAAERDKRKGWDENKEGIIINNGKEIKKK